MREYKSFYKAVPGGEGRRCRYSARLDTYGRGCRHDCSYCYAKGLLSFRGLWDPGDPAAADIGKIRRKLDRIPEGTVLRLGGMTDCFQPAERELQITLKTIEMMNERGIGYLVVTKSGLVAEGCYMAAMRKDLAHVQVSVTCVDDDLYRKKGYEKAPLPSERIAAVLKLQEEGFDAAVRLSPLIEEFMDFGRLNSFGIRRAVVEFLRVNYWTRKWLPLDYSRYTVREGGYRHLPLEEKRRILERIRIPSVTVCEDVEEHYRYWKHYVNPNPDDCCNLRVAPAPGAG